MSDVEEAEVIEVEEAKVEEAPEALEIAEEVVAEVVEEEAPAPQPEADTDSIAAKLQRIRAVVSKSRDVSDEDDFSEDEHAEIPCDRSTARRRTRPDPGR